MYTENPDGALAPQFETIEVSETKMFEQLAILVFDVSPSHHDIGETGQPKYQEVAIAVRGFVGRIQHSKNVDNFLLAGLRFSDQVDADFIPVTAVREMQAPPVEAFEPAGGGTALGDALKAAMSVATQWLSQPSAYPKSVVIAGLTDGMSNCGSSPEDAAAEIKKDERITLCMAGYGKGAGIDALLLQKIVSRPDCYSRVYDPEELRAFFIRSLTTRVQAAA